MFDISPDTEAWLMTALIVAVLLGIVAGTASRWYRH
jgi:hypothetical protein